MQYHNDGAPMLVLGGIAFFAAIVLLCILVTLAFWSVGA